MFSKPSSAVVLLLSLSVAACNSPGAQPPAPASKPVVTVAKTPPAVVTTAAVQPIAAAVAPAPVAPPATSTSKPTGISVKRFVVASAVENREPLRVETVALGELPLFAFAELANAGEADKIMITFELEGSPESVGHVELAVPAETQRWRTWGKTNLIGKPGRWSAVLRDQSGKELARTPFEVTRLTSEGDGRKAPES
ncbi:MAG TPA: DUF2914 domain-containing protein [Polyangiaceae bacterium]|nr:DUF2914 domain-containing protein [Polyangiaceae bacterium]